MFIIITKILTAPLMLKYLQPDIVHRCSQQTLRRSLPKHNFAQIFRVHSIKRKVKSHNHGGFFVYH